MFQLPEHQEPSSVSLEPWESSTSSTDRHWVPTGAAESQRSYPCVEIITQARGGYNPIHALYPHAQLPSSFWRLTTGNGPNNPKSINWKLAYCSLYVLPIFPRPFFPSYQHRTIVSF